MNNSRNIIQAIKQTVKGKYPDAKIILYGSRARGTYRTDSDWDLLILLNLNTITHEIEESVTYPLYDLEIEYGEVISPMVYSMNDWNDKYSVTPLYKTIMTEGKML